jgi:hypothetical protein
MSSRGKTIKGGPPAWGLDVGLKTSGRKKEACYETINRANDLDYFDKRLKRQNTYMTFGTWNIRSLYRGDSPMAVSKELFRYRLDLVGVQEVRWECSGTARAGAYTYYYGFFCT